MLLGLEALHERGLVHRDLKPENVLVTDAGAVLIDMDLVASAREGRGAGTLGFLAPEVLGGARPSLPATCSLGRRQHGAGLARPSRAPLPQRRLVGPLARGRRRAGGGEAPVLACPHRSPAARPVDARGRDLLEDRRGLDRSALPELVSDADPGRLARTLRSGRAATCARPIPRT